MAEPDAETVDITGDDLTQGFVSYSEEGGLTPKFFEVSELSEETSIYYIYLEETKLFCPKMVQNVVSTIKI